MQERETTRKNRQEHGERNAKENMGRLNVSVKCMRISSEKQHEKERQRSPEKKIFHRLSLDTSFPLIHCCFNKLIS